MKMKKQMSVQLTEEQKKKILPFLRRAAQAELNQMYAIFGIDAELNGGNPIGFTNKEWNDVQKHLVCFAEQAISGERGRVYVGLEDVQPYIDSCKTLRRFHSTKQQRELSVAAREKIALAQRAKWKAIKKRGAA